MKVAAILLAAILLTPLGAFPSTIPDIIKHPESLKALEYANSIGLTKDLPELKSILLEQAYGQENQGKKLGKGQLIIDGSSTPLQRGLENAVKNRQNDGKGNPNCINELAKENPDPDVVSKFCNSPKLQMLVDENCEGCGDIIENGKKVGFKIKTQTIIEFDDPEKGPKKKNGNVNDKWDDFMIGKPDTKGVGKFKNSNSQNSKLNGASAFPTFAINNDNDCIDLSTGEIFFGNPDDNTADDCFDEDGKINPGFRAQVDEDPEDIINDDFDCINTATGEIRGGLELFGQLQDDDVCFNPDGSLKDGFEELVNEDPAGNGNEDNDCRNTITGKVIGGFAQGANDGAASSCFDADGQLREGYEELVDEDDVDSIDNDSDGQIDEDGPESFEQNCTAAGGEVLGDECDLTKMAVKKANEESQKMTGEGFNFDNDCIETATGKIFGGAVEDGTAHSCFDENGDLKDGFEELVDEDGPEPQIDNDSDGRTSEDPADNGNEDKDCEDADGNHFGGFIGNSNNLIQDGAADSCFENDGSLKAGMTELTDEDGDELPVNNDNDCMDSDGKIFGGTIDDGDAHSCFNANGTLKNGFDELVDEDDTIGIKIYKANDDGTSNPNAKGEVEYGTEKRIVVINEEFEIRIPEQAAIENNPNAASANVSNDIFSQIQNFFSSLFGFETNIPKAYAASVDKDIIMGFTFAPPNIKWGIDYEKKGCTPAVKIFGKTIIPEICIVLLGVFIGYDFGIAVGLRLPIGVTASVTPDITRPEKIVNLESSVAPKDFTAKEYKDLCNDNDLKNQQWLITNCDRFSFTNFYDEINPLVPDNQKDGDEFVARYKAKAGVFVTVLGIPIIQWGINQENDLGAMCTYALATSKVDKLALIQALLAGPQFNPPSLSVFLKDLGVNCSSFTTPFGDEEDGLTQKARSFPIAAHDFTIRASCIDALILGETLVIKGQVIPICTGVYLFYAGASLGAGFGLSTSLGSKTIKADWSSSGDATPASKGTVTYDGTGQLSPIPGTFSGNLIGDNYDPNTDDLTLLIDDYTYFLNVAEVRGTAILDFGGLLEFISDIPAFTLFRYNFFDTIPGNGIPIPQHPFTSGVDSASIFVENYALELVVEANAYENTPDEIKDLEPGTPETYNVFVENTGNVEDDFQNFDIKFTKPPSQADLSSRFETTPDAATFAATLVENLPDDATSGALPIDINPVRHFTTVPGIYEFNVIGDSSTALGFGIAGVDPLGNFRLDSPGSILFNVLPFPNPLVDVTPDTSTIQPSDIVVHDIEIDNQGNLADDITLLNEFDDWNTSGCNLTTLGSDVGCPYRAVPTAIQQEWTNIDNIPGSSGLLDPGQQTVLSPQLSVVIPSDWAGMTTTTYNITSTVTSTIDAPTNDPPISTNDVTEITVEPTKESMMRYIGLEIDELTAKIVDADASGVKTGGLLPLLQKPIADSYSKAFENVLAGNFDGANKNLSTLQKQMDAFVFALNGLDGKTDKLGADGDDWLASAEAILADIQTTIDFN